VETDDALNDFNASVQVRFDVAEQVNSEKLLPEVVLSEDDEDALMFPIDSSRVIEGGQQKIETYLMDLFNEMLTLENFLSNDSQNVQLK
jgi:hypothetical protein